MPRKRTKFTAAELSKEDGIVLAKSFDGSEDFLLFYGGTPYLSNFHPSPFTVDGIEFVNNEQYFHYKKAELFCDSTMMTEILATNNPRTHKQCGRSVRDYDQTIWDDACRAVMLDGLRAKFSQNADLLKLLLDTEDAVLVEASPRDRKWGIGLGKDSPEALDRRNWRGSNMLGTLLMQVRDQMKLNPLERGMRGGGSQEGVRGVVGVRRGGMWSESRGL